MSYAVEIAETARNDLWQILDFISLDNPRRAAAFVDELQARIERKLGPFPNSGTAIGPHRFTVFSGYVVVYKVDEAALLVQVMMITESHRDWRSIFEDRG